MPKLAPHIQAGNPNTALGEGAGRAPVAADAGVHFFALAAVTPAQMYLLTVAGIRAGFGRRERSVHST